MSTATVSQISEKLYFMVVKLSADRKLNWSRACDLAAVLIETNTKEYEKLITDAARRRYNSEFMKQLNEAKKTVAEQIRQNEDNFHVPCSVCKKPMHFSSSDEEWNENDEQEILYKAFMNWSHDDCGKK